MAINFETAKTPGIEIPPGMLAMRSTLRSREGSMIAVIFEVWPKPDKKQRYLALAATLRPILERIDGFISVERFESLTEPGKILSLSFFRDEAAVAIWRNIADHRRAQAAGRAEIFANYRLRIASVIRDYGMRNREQAPIDSQASHDQIIADLHRHDN